MRASAYNTAWFLASKTLLPYFIDNTISSHRILFSAQYLNNKGTISLWPLVVPIRKGVTELAFHFRDKEKHHGEKIHRWNDQRGV
jgi:hypothetical protein